jgi:outer membrane lipoprotein carrier protein
MRCFVNKQIMRIIGIVGLSLLPGLSHALDLNKVVDGVQAFYDSKGSLQATFSQVVKRPYRPGSQKATPRTGVAFFQKPGKMRWDYQVPEQEYYVSDGTTLWIYEVKKNIAYKKNIENSRLYNSMKFLFGAGNLREEFNLSLGKTGDNEVELVLIPKAGEQVFKKLVLVVDAKTYEIQRTVLTDPGDAISTIAFQDVNYGEIENPEWFAWEPGEGIEVQVLDQNDSGGR